MSVGPRRVTTGIRTGLRALLGSATATVDASSGKYVPASAGEFASIGLTSPTSLWLCQEAAGSLADSIGSNALSATSTPSYQNAVAGWTRKAVGTADGAGGMGFLSTTVGDTTAGSALLLAYVAVTSTPLAAREVMGVGGSADHRYAGITATPAYFAGINGGASVNGASNPSTTVRPVIVQVNKAASAFKVYTDQEVITGGWTAPAGGGALLILGDALSGAAQARYLWACCYTGADAELSQAQVKSMLQTLGWTIPW